MNIKATRLRNFRRILDGRSMKLKDVAALLDKAPSQVSAFAGRNPTKGIGDQIARQIERVLDLHEGYLDMPYGPDEFSGTSVLSHTGRKIPVLTAATALMSLKNNDEFDVKLAKEWLDPPGPVGPHAFIMMVEGMSMQPRFVEGDRVVIDPSLEAHPGDFVAVQNISENTLILRQLFQEGNDKFLYALNADWPNRIVPSSPNWAIVGRAQWNISEL